MKKLITALLLTGLLAGCASNTVVNSKGVEVPNAELTAKYYDSLGDHRKATLFKKVPSGQGFWSNAFNVSTKKDNFRGMSWRTYKPMFGFSMFFGEVNHWSNRFSIYFPQNDKGVWSKPFIQASYYGDDWLFFDTISVKADGKKAITLTTGRFNTEREVITGSGGKVLETYNKQDGAIEFLNYLKGVEDGERYKIRLISRSRSSEHVEYSYNNNKAVIDEMLSLIK